MTYLRFEVFTTVTVKNAVFWDVRARNQREQVAAVCSLKMEAIRSSETSVHTSSTWRHIPENGILQ
jgi:hypothetical protein